MNREPFSMDEIIRRAHAHLAEHDRQPVLVCWALMNALGATEGNICAPSEWYRRVFELMRALCLFSVPAPPMISHIEVIAAASEGFCGFDWVAKVAFFSCERDAVFFAIRHGVT